MQDRNHCVKAKFENNKSEFGLFNDKNPPNILEQRDRSGIKTCGTAGPWFKYLANLAVHD